MSIQAVVFDLDDTLYDENDYFRSGLHVVAEYLSERYHWAFADIDRQLQQSLAISRDNIIDRVLKQKGVWSESLLAACYAVYREHIPNIRLSHQTKRLLKVYSEQFAVYVVTDGDSVIQQNKLQVLGLTSNKNIKRIIKMTNYSREIDECLSSITEIENCAAGDLVFVSGARDFNSLKVRGFKTIRVTSDNYPNRTTDDQNDAEFHVDNLSSAYDLIEQLP